LVFRKNIVHIKDENGSTTELTPIASPWYISYVMSPQVDDDTFNKKFKHHFRLTYSMFVSLLNTVKQSDEFDWWMRLDAFYRSPSPIELLLLGTLRYIGRGWTFDDLQEATGISEETHRQFLHVFIDWGSTAFYSAQVQIPSTNEIWETHHNKYAMAGLNGCVGSMDATHVVMEKCPHARSNQHKGPKQSLPARTYNICVNHRGKILSSTKGHPARWNDKTLVLFDPIAIGLNKGTLLTNKFFFISKRIRWNN
jgi:hypothetical protein